MPTPISTDKILPSTAQKGGKSTGETASATPERKGANPHTPEVVAAPDDTIDVERATRVFRNAPVQPSGSRGNIDSPGDATRMVARIREQIEENGAQALRAQSGALPDHIGSLLNTEG